MRITITIAIVLLLASCKQSEKVTYRPEAYDSLGNIYVKFSADSIRQITFSGRDSSPLFLDSLDLIIYQRIHKKSDSLMLCSIQLKGLAENKLRTGLNTLKDLTSSYDQTKISYIADSELCILDLSNNQEEVIEPSFGYTRFRGNDYQDNLLSIKVDFEDDLKYAISYDLLEPDGSLKKHFEKVDAVKAFIEQESPQNLNVVSQLLDRAQNIDEKISELSGMYDKYQKTRELISYKEDELNDAYDKLNRINQFQIGRSQSEKDRQLRNQKDVISNIENEINELKNELESIEEQANMLVSEIENT